jgi:phosphohistidine phosphatase
MKRLAILRHAKSRADEQGLGDFSRPLNEQGWQASRRVGRELALRRFRFDLVLASPAIRVRETIQGIAEDAGLNAPIQFDERLYLATCELLVEILRGLPEAVHSPLLVGHNPGLQQLVLALSNEDDDSLRCQISKKLPTGGFALVEVRADRWAEVERTGGRIVELISPRDLS